MDIIGTIKRILIEFLIGSTVFLIAIFLSGNLEKFFNQNYFEYLMLSGFCMFILAFSSLISFIGNLTLLDFNYFLIKLKVAIILIIIGASGTTIFYHKYSPITEYKQFEKSQENNICKWDIKYEYEYKDSEKGKGETLFIDTKENMLKRMDQFIYNFKVKNPDKEFKSFYYFIDPMYPIQEKN